MECERNNFKIIVIGDSGVGKTCLLHRFTENEFKVSQITIGVDFSIHTIRSSTGQTITGRYWDTAGLERYRSVLQVCYRGADGAIIVYDMTKKSSFVSVSSWVKALRQNCGVEIPMILVGNKNDLVRPTSLSLGPRAPSYGVSTSTSPCVNRYNPPSSSSSLPQPGQRRIRRRQRRRIRRKEKRRSGRSMKNQDDEYEVLGREDDTVNRLDNDDLMEQDDDFPLDEKYYYPRRVTREEGLELSKELGFTEFFETSAKTGKNVKFSFEYILRNVYRTYPKRIESGSRQAYDPLFEIKNIDEDFENSRNNRFCFGLCKL